MKESTEQLLKDLIDLIEFLKQKNKCESVALVKLWEDKLDIVREKIDMLPLEERTDFDREYEIWFKEKQKNKL